MEGALRRVLSEGQGLVTHPTTMKRRWGARIRQDPARGGGDVTVGREWGREKPVGRKEESTSWELEAWIGLTVIY